jgi:hypothetical protein
MQNTICKYFIYMQTKYLHKNVFKCLLRRYLSNFFSSLPLFFLYPKYSTMRMQLDLVPEKRITEINLLGKRQSTIRGN